MLTKNLNTTNRTLCLLLCLVLPQTALAWGQIGHRITGAIAEQHLTLEAKQQVENILGLESLAEASTYADEMRSNPSKFWQETAGPWHYVTIPKGKSYLDVGAPPQGDAISALKRFKTILRNPDAPQREKQLALRFIVHIIGDLHQPLHAGNGTDRGGNDRKLMFFWQETNLHRVWDSQMIDRRQLSYSEWTAWLNKYISTDMLESWQETDPKVWVKESTEYRDTLYPESDEISWDYLYQHMPTVKLRLQQAGIRIASYLNQVFAE